MADVVSHHRGDLFYAAAVSGLEGVELEFIERLLNRSEWKSDDRDKHGLLAMLAMAVFNEHQPDRVSRLLELADNQRGDQLWRRDELISGILSSHFSRAKWPQPIHLPHRTILIDTLRAATDQAASGYADQLVRVLTWPGDTTDRPQKPNPRPLTNEEQKQFSLGQAIYAVTCHACHHADGQGQVGKAPPLVESEWVNGPPERLVRIALHGLTGPVKVRDREWNLTMPGLGQSVALDDQRMAAVLTYVRRAWDNWSDPIRPATVAEIRRQSAGRAHMWTAAELLGLDETNANVVATRVETIDSLSKYRDALDAGDAERGRILFHTNLTLRCRACHVIGETGGGFVGPELTDVGARENREYLLESLIDPSAKIVKGYDTLVILTVDGQSIAGTFVSENDEKIVIAPPDGGTVTVTVDDIDQRFTSPISSMPPVGELFTIEQLSDLVAYLASLQSRPPKCL